MTKTTNLSAIIAQHLRGLQQSGMSIVPTQRGYSFDLVDAKTEAPPSSTNSAEATTEAAMVKEASPGLTTIADQQAEAPPESASSSPPPPRRSIASRVVINAPYASPVADRANALDVLQQDVAGCTRCTELATTRKNTVFGVGNPDARLVLLGEAPGEREDRLAEPFVGAAGQLLDKILAACGLNRQQDVYILNAIKCRPPQNRTPRQEELENCWSYAQQQLDILQPEFICCLGSVAARTLLQTTLSVGRLRRQFHTYRGSKVLVTYHPAYLLRTTSAKKHAWEDMQMLMKEMGIPIPQRS